MDPDNPLPPGLPGVDYKPFVTPNNISMPFEIRGGVKVMHMVAEEVKHKFADGIECYTWGYNGRTHWPTIEAVEGERLRIYVTNKLPAPTTAVDGWRVLPENQEPAVTVFMPVGRTRNLEIVANNEGDWIFHCHRTHHIMNQMNSNFPNKMGMSSAADARVREVLPGYMTMGAAGMNDRTGKPMAPVPTNSIPMKEGRGPYGVNTVAGMANLLKVRSDVSDADLAANRDPGHYYAPKRTIALPATREELARDGITA